jgi:hypothetical protein
MMLSEQLRLAALPLNAIRLALAIAVIISQLTSSLPEGIGSAIGTGVGLVFTYASGSVLYRRITAK